MARLSHTSAGASDLRSLHVAGHKVDRPERQPRPAIEWRSSDGARHVLPPSQVIGKFFEDEDPVRGAPSFRGQWSKPGRYWMSRTGRHVPYESRFEMQHLKLLDHDPDVVSVAWQPFRVHFGRDQAPYTHVPDLFVRRSDNTASVIDVKGALAADREDNQLVFALTKCVCSDAGLDYQVATEPDPVVLANVTWLAGYRRTVPYTSDATQALLDASADGATIATIVAQAAQATGLHALLVRPVLFHLLWRHQLGMAHDRVLDDDTPVFPGGSDQ